MIPFTFVLASNLRFLQLLPKIVNGEKKKKLLLLAFCIGKKAADYSVESGWQCVCVHISPSCPQLYFLHPELCDNTENINSLPCNLSS